MPVIHITDLFTPPGDPDDHFDLLTLLGACGSEVSAVVIDHTVEQGLPGTSAVARAAALYGLGAIPCAVGLHNPLVSEKDAARDRPDAEQAAIELILASLRKCPDHGMIFTLVGSLRDLAAAYNRDPSLFHAKTARLFVNGGDSCGEVGPRDWNTALDLFAWKRIMSSGLPIDWFPCNPSKGRGSINNHVSYWSRPQNELLGDCPDSVKAFFESEFISTTDTVTRHLWSTVSFREVAKFVGHVLPESERVVSYTLEPVALKIGDDGTARWSRDEAEKFCNVRLLTIRDSAAYSADMVCFLKACFNNINL